MTQDTVLAQNKVGVFQVRRESKNKEGATGDEEQNQDDNIICLNVGGTRLAPWKKP